MADNNVETSEREYYMYYKNIYDLYQIAELEFKECVESVDKYVKDFNDPTMDLTYKDKVFGGVSNSEKRARRANIITRLLNSIEFYSKFLLCAEKNVLNGDVKSSKSIIESYMSSFGHNSKITFIELIKKLPKEDVKKMEDYIKPVDNRTNEYTPYNLIDELESLFKDEINSTIATKGRYNIPNMEKFNRGSFVICMGYVAYLRDIGRKTFDAMRGMLVDYEKNAGLYQAQHVSQDVKGGDAQ